MSAPSTEPEDLGAFALGKLTRVFGEARGTRLHREVLGELGVPGLRSPDELLAFARRLAQRGGMEAAVGGLLGVAAVPVVRSASAVLREVALLSELRA